LKGVENPDIQLPEIRFVSRGDDQLVNACSRGKHSILQQSGESLSSQVLVFCFITTVPFMLACRQKYSMNRRLCAAGSAF
jgi:hypothetical protein